MAAPVGPIGILCIRRTLAQGRLAGFVSGLGVALADTIYAGVAALGIGAVDETLTAHERLIKVIGGAVVCYLGVKMVRMHPPDPSGTQVAPRNLPGDFVSMTALTLLNPQTILSFGALFGTAAHFAHASTRAVPEIVTGVFVGSAAWWAFLALLTGYLRTTLNARALHRLCMGAGVVVIGFGLWIFASIFVAPALP